MKTHRIYKSQDIHTVTMIFTQIVGYSHRSQDIMHIKNIQQQRKLNGDRGYNLGLGIHQTYEQKTHIMNARRGRLAMGRQPERVDWQEECQG